MIEIYGIGMHFLDDFLFQLHVYYLSVKKKINPSFQLMLFLQFLQTSLPPLLPFTSHLWACSINFTYKKQLFKKCNKHLGPTKTCLISG